MTPFHSDWQIHAATTVTNVETRDIFVRCPLHCFYIYLHPNLQINGVRDYIMSGASSVLQRRCCTLTTRFPSRCRQCPVWRLVRRDQWKATTVQESSSGRRASHAAHHPYARVAPAKAGLTLVR